jgi:hypothetical protein
MIESRHTLVANLAVLRSERLHDATRHAHEVGVALVEAPAEEDREANDVRMKWVSALRIIIQTNHR